MSGVKQATLVTLYCTVCGNHSIIEEKTQHLLNHRFPKFSDEARITAYLWGKKVATDYCDKSYNSSRKEYYYGVQLHSIVIRRAGFLPDAEIFMLSKASVSDWTAAK